MQYQSVGFETVTDILFGGVKSIIQGHCLCSMKGNSLDGRFLNTGIRSSYHLQEDTKTQQRTQENGIERIQ